MPAIVKNAATAVKKTANTAKETIRESAAYAVLYPDSGVSKVYHTAHAVLDPVGFSAPAMRLALILASSGVPLDAVSTLLFFIALKATSDS